MKYDYSIVRFVPDAFRGEFVNVAVIVGSEDSGEWEIRMAGNPQHARRLDNGKGIEAVWAYLATVQDLIDTSGEDELDDITHDVRPGRRWLESEHLRLRNLVQITPPTGIVADSANAALEMLFDIFVVDTERASRRTRAAAVTALRDAYDSSSLQSRGLVHERVRARVGKQQTTIDFAIANGHLVQLSHGWSFQTRDPSITVQQIKAWSWTVRDLRDFGGTIQFRNGQVCDVPNDVNVNVVYVDPESDDGRNSLDEALEVFEHLRVKAVNTRDVAQVVDDAIKDLR